MSEILSKLNALLDRASAYIRLQIAFPYFDLREVLALESGSDQITVGSPTDISFVVVVGLLGVGGGLVATPLLTGLFGQRQALAQSLSMALVTPCAVVALATYSVADCVDWSMGLPLAFGGLLTVSAGVAVAHQLPERKMRLLFAVMLMGTALWLLIKPYVVG